MFLLFPSRIVTFSSIHHLSIHLQTTNPNDDELKLYYIGLKGDFTEGARARVVNAVYEARPMLEDHKQDVEGFGASANNQGF